MLISNKIHYFRNFAGQIYEMECLRASVSEIKFLYLGKCKDNIL